MKMNIQMLVGGSLSPMEEILPSQCLIIHVQIHMDSHLQESTSAYFKVAVVLDL
jgi:hypothetical protein